MSEALKIVIPMAGWGTRMRPHTWNKPKPLVGVAGRTALDYLMDVFASIPDRRKVEFVFIVGPYLGELQIPPFIQEHYPGITAHYVVQAEMKGQSHGIYLARQYLRGPMISCFSDTLIDADFSVLDREKCDGIAWVQEVPDPRRFGVAEVNPDGWVTRLVEKPQSLENNLALVGCYYFRRSEDLMSAIEEQMQSGIQLKNEFFLADAVNIMLGNRALFRTQRVATWLDTGTIAATLETNRHMLDRMWAARPQSIQRPDVRLVPPVFVHETAQLESCVVGPHASIGAGCRISGSRIEDSILESDCSVTHTALRGSLIGCRSTIEGPGLGEVFSLNIGDDSSVRLAAGRTGTTRDAGKDA
jgi:glucose-1-phosphate thymidylyltransferase